MLNNKKFNIVLALVIAVGLWAYVIGETNPQDTRTFREIPIQFVNEDVLESEGLAVKSVSDELISVSLTGVRADINRIDSREIIAFVDLADAAQGENQLKISLKTPEDAEVEDKSLNKVTVVVEKRVSRAFDIKPMYKGTFGSEEEPITVEMSRSAVTVTGAESLVDKVDHVQASVGEGEVTDKLKTIGSRLVPVDRNGKEVKPLALSAGSVQITAELASVRTVDLEVPIIDRSNGDTKRKVTAPKTITIKGKSSDLRKIDTVTAQPVDISDLTETVKLQLIPILPEGVQVSEKSAGNLTVTVEVQKLEEKQFIFDIADVALEGLGEDLNAELKADSRIEVTLRGSRTQLEAIKRTDISLSVDLADLDLGTHRVVLHAACSREHSALNVFPEELRVVIE